jgi:hypothetical protein
MVSVNGEHDWSVIRTYRKWSSSAVQPMLLAKRRTSRLSQVTSWGGYSNPTPGPLILVIGSVQRF